MSKFDGHYGFQRMFQEGKMTLGFHIPLEAYEWEAPTMERQVELVQAAEDYGFTGIWLRDAHLFSQTGRVRGKIVLVRS